MATEEKTYLLPLFILIFLLFWSPEGPDLDLEDNAAYQEDDSTQDFREIENKLSEASSVYYGCQRIVFLEEILEINGEEEKEEYEKALADCRKGLDFYERASELEIEEAEDLKLSLLDLADEVNQFSVAIIISDDRSIETRESARQVIPSKIEIIREELSKKEEDLRD